MLLRSSSDWVAMREAGGGAPLRAPGRRSIPFSARDSLLSTTSTSINSFNTASPAICAGSGYEFPIRLRARR